MSPSQHRFVKLLRRLGAFAAGQGWIAGLALALTSATAALACDAAAPCDVAGGSYLVSTPAGWDGRSALPVIVFFHGAFSDAKDSMAREDLRAAARSVGALFVAADGANKNWSFPGKMSTNRDDVAYTNAVLDDVARRFPIDKSSILASGFSVGGSMTWYLACLMHPRITAFAPVAGAFWEPLPDDCPAGPVSLRHVHGLADGTVPMQGRALRGGLYKQGDVLESFRRLRTRNGCGEEPDREETSGVLVCRTWAAGSCTSKREAVLCLHPGEHYVDGAWVAEGFRWMQGLKGR